MSHIPGPPQPNNQGMTLTKPCPFCPHPCIHAGHLLPVCLLYNYAYCSLIPVQILAVPSNPQLAAAPSLPSGFPVDP